MKQENLEITMDPQEISVEVMLEKYAKGDEKTIQDVRRRVARGLAAVETDPAAWEEKFFQNLENGFVPGGRIHSAAGTDMQATLINCFVQPVGDCITGEDSNGYPSIYSALADAAETMRRGGGVGYDFSRIRPEGAMVHGTRSRASGPLSYMRVFDRSCETVESAGARRGAQMGVMRCDHPDIYKFVKAKDEKGSFNNFNLSIGVTDEFMQAVIDGADWNLVHRTKPCDDYMTEHGSYYDEERMLWVWKTVPALDLWELVMRSTYDHAEPGILFLDRMNAENNLWYCETIEATNPCAEQPLPPYGCCCLGSINLTKFVRHPFTFQAYFDSAAFVECVKMSIRMLDNVLNATQWPLEKQHQEAMNKRRIGLGFLGIGDAMLMLGISYDKEDGVRYAQGIAETMRDAAYTASCELAVEKGSFPLLNADKYLEGQFVRRLPDQIKAMIRENGIRNSHLLSIAPTGTITLAFADNASNGIEPPFSWTYTRKKRMDDGSYKEYEVADHAWRLYRAMGHDMENLPEHFVTALSMSVNAHVDVMKAVQPYCDTAISKTVNIPGNYPYEDFKDLYVYAWRCGLKGLATYRPNDILGSVLSVKEDQSDKADDPVSGKEPSSLDNLKFISDTLSSDQPPSVQMVVDKLYSQSFESREDGELDGVSIKGRFHTSEGEQKFILTMNFLEMSAGSDQGQVIIRRPMEFLMTSNFAASSSAWDMAMRFMSLMARSGVPLPKIIENMREITWEHGNVRYGSRIKDGRKVPLWHSSDVAVIGYVVEEALKNRGYLTQDGELAKQFTLIPSTTGSEAPVVINPVHDQETQVEIVVEKETKELPRTGKKCKECGSFNVVKRDGCEICENCGQLGSCG